MPMLKARYALLVLLLLGLPVWGSGCAVPPQEAPREAAAVLLTGLEQRDFHETVRVSGYVKAHREVRVFVELPGRVEEVLVKMGDPVEKGDLLVRLDSRDQEIQLLQARAALTGAQAQYAEALAGARPQDLEQARAALRQAESAYTAAKNNLERLEVLYGEGMISLQEKEGALSQYESAAAALATAQAALQKLEEGPTSYTLQALQAQLLQAEAAYSAAQRQLERMSINAPISGKVAAVHLHTGEQAAAGTPAVTIVDDDPVFIDVYVDEAYIAYIAPGDSARVDIPAALPGGQSGSGGGGDGGRHFQGTVREISPAALAGSRSFLVRIELPNREGAVRHGMFASVLLRARFWQGAVVVPASAVQQREGRDYIFFYDEGTARAVEVRTGEQLDGMVQVEGDLLPLPVIARAPRSLNDGDPVKAVENGR